MIAGPASATAVVGSAAAQAPWSMFPLTATTGARVFSASTISGLPTSPAWMIRSDPCSACSASSRNTPWVSEISPMVVRLFPTVLMLSGQFYGWTVYRESCRQDETQLAYSFRRFLWTSAVSLPPSPGAGPEMRRFHSRCSRPHARTTWISGRTVSPWLEMRYSTRGGISA